ncbi:hypothetical protein TBLA_0F02290 [Henningerozyma blattae CBS 6284]|uniref:DNA-directed RNA polymerase III subunit RPC4 n=1 Tax=Henningerozyma blattae (strain ATCC 34711 / CBS 6284 / DSM 70876 / NBRC 10599 / NRRL Y-10934 / UCD 77-7) TaxID=1071380 RepID=I2H5W8_HENB6|nr:hypothetical protein TBLA_0F02290 [Tetrapisispora blattae CBS 6284]CCH61770.1 hypothetical protein TBLA_0F02290 [Tetrapisispora blattae CBS 6284]
MPGNQQRRLPRYLQNTHVVSSGPLAAGNFSSDKNGEMRRSYFKSGNSDSSSLVQKGLQTFGNADSISDDENEDKMAKGDKGSRFNMGREMSLQDWKKMEKELEQIEDDTQENIDPDDEEAWQAKRIEELFPVRPLRILHDDGEVHSKSDNTEEATSTEPSTREDTPIIKTEPDVNIKMEHSNEETVEAALSAEVNNNATDDPEMHAINEEEIVLENVQYTNDHNRILHKLHSINDKDGKFVFVQLPNILPDFTDLAPPKPESVEDEDTNKDGKENSGEKAKAALEKKPTKRLGALAKKAKKKDEGPPIVNQKELSGRIGTIRVHKSGKLSVKIGDVIMDVARGADPTFFQDIIAFNEKDENPVAEHLGLIDEKIIVMPKF